MSEGCGEFSLEAEISVSAIFTAGLNSKSSNETIEEGAVEFDDASETCEVQELIDSVAESEEFVETSEEPEKSLLCAFGRVLVE